MLERMTTKVKFRFQTFESTQLWLKPDLRESKYIFIRPSYVEVVVTDELNFICPTDRKIRMTNVTSFYFFYQTHFNQYT